jgi:small-conductance mechanosensitive channel
MHWIVEAYLDHRSSLHLTLAAFLVFFILRDFLKRLIKVRGQKQKIADDRVLYMRKLFNVLLTVLLILVLGGVWEISLHGISLYFVSIFTVLGVSLFATWSVLSNLTSSVLIFFFFPYRIGQKIRIMDGDDSVEGKILDINLFYIRIISEDNKIIAYPNSLAIQKPLTILH